MKFLEDSWLKVFGIGHVHEMARLRAKSGWRLPHTSANEA
jgi:hypothetical protein